MFEFGVFWKTGVKATEHFGLILQVPLSRRELGQWGLRPGSDLVMEVGGLS
jgi:hypothetical protein